MGQLSGLDPATLKAFESYMGLPQDGTWDPELAKRVAGYQQLLGQTPGQTDDAQQWEALTGQLAARGAAFADPGDSTAAQDPAFQTFMRNAGARESEILDEINYRTEQNSREINRRAAGFAAQKDEATTNAGLQRQQGTERIRDDFAGRGFGGANTGRTQADNQLNTQIDTGLQQQTGQIDEQQMSFNAGQRDALSEATRRLNSDANSLYRRRVDEEFNARERISKDQNQRSYGG